MKVPSIDAPSVESRPLQPQWQQTQGAGEGYAAAAQGVGQLVQGLSRYDEAVRAAKAKAEAIDDANLTNEFQAGTTSIMVGDSSQAPAGATPEQIARRRAGYLQLQGKAAFEGSQPALDEVEKLRRRLAAKLSSPEAQARWLAKSGAMYQSIRQKVEDHAADQFRVAEDQSLQGLKATTLRAVEADPRFEAVAETNATVEDAIRRVRTGRSPELVEAEVQQYRAQTAESAMQAYMANVSRDWQSAESALVKYRPHLDAKVAKSFENTIRTAKDDVEGEKVAAGMVALAVQLSGKVDEDAARSTVDSVPEGPLRDEVRQRLEHRLNQARQNWKQAVDVHFDSGLTAYIRGGNSLGAVSPADKAWLLENEPTKWRELQMMAQRDLEHLKAMGRIGAGKETDEQRDAFIELQADIARNPSKYNDQAYTPSAFRSEWGPRLSSKDFESAGAMYAKTLDDDRLKAADWKKRVDEAIKSNPALQLGVSKDKKTGSAVKDADLFAAEMYRVRDDFRAQQKRDPTLEEANKLTALAWVEYLNRKAGMTKRGVSRPAPGDQPVAPAAPDAAAPVAVPKFEAVGPGGQRALVNDAFLKTHPDWKRR